MEEIITKGNLDTYTLGLKGVLSSMGEAILNAGSSNAGEEITITHSNGTGNAHVEVKSGDTVLNANVASGGTVSVPFGIEYTIRALDSNGSTIKEITKVASRMSSSYSFDLTDISVDLGLPSGKIWALYNVGSNNNPNSGFLVSYGNVIPTPGQYFDVGYSNTPGGMLTHKYNSGDIRYDAATYNMGGNWRTPTKDEWLELLDNCTRTTLSYTLYNGACYTSKTNGNKIYFYNKSVYAMITNSNYGTDQNGSSSNKPIYFWTCTTYISGSNVYPYCAYAVGGFYGGAISVSYGWNNGNFYRYYGGLVRAIHDPVSQS